MAAKIMASMSAMQPVISANGWRHGCSSGQLAAGMCEMAVHVSAWPLCLCGQCGIANGNNEMKMNENGIGNEMKWRKLAMSCGEIIGNGSGI
jgi:hypothetical protein